MSAQLPPDPILTTYQYWNWLNVDEATRRQRALDNNYMMFPTVQNKPTTFSKMFVELITSLTQIASTFTIEDRLVNFLFAANTWTSLNTFGSIDTYSITTNTITATTLALSGTQLDTPMTTNQTYPITPFTPTSGTVNYGTAGTIGYTIVASQNNGALTNSGITPGSFNDYRIPGYFSNARISVPPGVWILHLEFVTAVIYGITLGLCFGTTPLTATDPQLLTTKKVGMFGCDYAPNNNTGIPNQNTISSNQIISHYSNTTGSNVMIYGFLAINGYGYDGRRATMTAVKIG